MMRLLFKNAVVFAMTFVALNVQAGDKYKSKSSHKEEAQEPKWKTENILTHSWAGKKINAAVWGIAAGDVDGDGSNEIVLLERNAVRVGKINGDEFKINASYEWKGFIAGVRIFTMNLDNDPAEEIVVSAVEDGRPASFALKWSNDEFHPMFWNEPWHIRVVENLPNNGGKILAGQQWASSSFFTGAIFKLSFDGGKLTRGDRITLPKRTEIFNFAILPAGAEEQTLTAQDPPFINYRVFRLAGFEHLVLFEPKGKKFKKVWASGERYGGSLNIIEAVEREVMNTATDQVTIDREPQFVKAGEGSYVYAIRHDIPLKGMIGRRPDIRSGTIVALREDLSFGFMKCFETEEVPGFISDFIIEPKRLIASVQLNPSMFYESRQSTLLIFELPE